MSSHRRNRRHEKDKKENQEITLLKKEDNSRKPTQSQQPKILIKPREQNQPQSEPIKNQKSEELLKSKDPIQAAPATTLATPITEVKNLKSPIKFITFPNCSTNSKVTEFLNPDNHEFLVVSCIGSKSSGKSTILNLLADSNYLQKNDEDLYEFSTPDAVFNAEKEITESLNLFITKDRLFLIDTWPLLNNQFKSDNVSSELNDLKNILILMVISHVLIVAVDDYINLNLMRLILFAENIKTSLSKYSNYSPQIIFVHNKTKTLDISREKLFENLYKKMFVTSQLKIYEEYCYPSFYDDQDADGKKAMLKTINRYFIPDVRLTNNMTNHKIHNQVKSLKQKISMLVRPLMWPVEVVTEAKWFQIVIQMTEAIRNDSFLRQYEIFREKFNQQHQSTVNSEKDSF